MLTHELKYYQWERLGLAEVRCTRFGETAMDEEYGIWYCGQDSKHQHGVAFIVREEVVGGIINCTPISSRLVFIRISARPHNIMQIYALTSDHKDKVEQFYKQLDSIKARNSW